MGMEDDDDEDEFAQLFADFNMDEDKIAPEDELFIDSISANLREAAGMGAGAQVHAGDVDEGTITWQAPSRTGLDSLDGDGPDAARARGVAAITEQMWASDEMQPSPDAYGKSSVNVSDNLLADLQAIETKAAGTAKAMDPQQAARAMDALQSIKVALPTFRASLQNAAAELRTTEDGTTLLNLFLDHKKIVSSA